MHKILRFGHTSRMKSLRTDMALEAREAEKPVPGLLWQEDDPAEGIRVTRAQVESDEAARVLGKPRGRYYTLEAPELSLRDPFLENRMSRCLAKELARLLPPPEKHQTVMVVGLGNGRVTPDSLGPKVTALTMVTRHLIQTIPEAMDRRVRSVCAWSPGVLGITGMETAELVRAVTERIRPWAIVAVDALASRESRRICVSCQVADTGIQPGSGVGNARNALTKETLGCPVIAVGVPTVVRASVLVRDALEAAGGGSMPEMQEDMMVTPKEIDQMVDDAAHWLAMGLNLWLHPGLSREEILDFMH